MIYEQDPRRLFIRLVVFSTLTLASAEAVADDKAANQLEIKADRFARNLLQNAYDLLHHADRKETFRTLMKISRKKPEIRSVYYEYIVEVARTYIQTTGDGPFTSAAHLLLCGTETCEPATYELPKSISGERGRDQAALIGGDVSRPVKLFSPPPRYTIIARKAGIQGSVIVQANINKQGDVTGVVVLKGLPMGLAENAARAVKGWKFTPSTHEGKPVDGYSNLVINFRLQ